MKAWNLALAVAAAAGLASGSAPQDSKPAASVEALAFFSGSWCGALGAATFEEHWTKPAGKTLIGMSRLLGGGRTIEFEYLRIEQRKDGLVYVAQPGGRPATDFKLTKASEGEVLFENAENDFPKRIRYQKTSEGLTATIDAGEGVRTMEFRMKPLR